MQITIYIGQKKFRLQNKIIRRQEIYLKNLNWPKLGLSTKLQNRCHNTVYLIGLGQNHTGLFMKLISSQKLKNQQMNSNNRNMTNS